MHIVAKEFSSFNEITVYDTNQLYGEMGKFRCLQFTDDAIQGAIDLKNPKRIVLAYHRAVIHLMMLNNPLFEKVFVIGHGIGTIAGHYTDKQFTVAEIDGKVVELSKLYFRYPINNVVVGDGREILRYSEQSSFDYIILDAFTHKGTPLHLTSMEFFEMTLAKLNTRGAIIMNLMGKAKDDRFINAIHTTLRKSYLYIKAFTQQSEDETDIRNIIVIGSNKMFDFQVRDMAGFFEIELGQGHIIRDNGKAKSNVFCGEG
ncbi:spermidine synthase [Cohnella sp.]|uniref:spermidine synthase n=1 Tax=Cohnella sp. TaxID=1883426 RepID=UPI003561492E